jgi:hypothetical protein
MPLIEAPPCEAGRGWGGDYVLNLARMGQGMPCPYGSALQMGYRPERCPLLTPPPGMRSNAQINRRYGAAGTPFGCGAPLVWGAAVNCSVSVDPLSATVADVPPVIVFCTVSK